MNRQNFEISIKSQLVQGFQSKYYDHWIPDRKKSCDYMTLPNITIAFAWLLLLASVRYSSGYLPPTLIRPVARILNKRQHFSQGPRTHRVRQKALIDDYSAFEDREREELSWLVLTTSKLIGNTALPVGTLEK
jgi:hypothetical protein